MKLIARCIAIVINTIVYRRLYLGFTERSTQRFVTHQKATKPSKEGQVGEMIGVFQSCEGT